MFVSPDLFVLVSLKNFNNDKTSKNRDLTKLFSENQYQIKIKNRNSIKLAKFSNTKNFISICLEFKKRTIRKIFFHSFLINKHIS